MKKAIIGLFLGTLLLLNILACTADPTNANNEESLDVVEFQDENLEMAIRSEIEKYTGDITVADMELLTYLEVDEENILNIAGLEYATNLEKVVLYSTEINDLSPLSGLTNLKSLELSSTEISDLSPLSSLTNLEYLHLYSYEMSDLSPLSELTTLKSITLNFYYINDLSPLSNLTNLKNLELFGNQVSDLSPLMELNSLEYLKIESNNINLTSNSSSMEIINSLQEAGVEVSY